MASRRREKRKLCLVAETSSGSDADTKNTNTSKRPCGFHHAAAKPSSETAKTTNRKRLRDSHDAAAEPSSDTTNTSSSKKPAVAGPDGSSGRAPSPGGQEDGKAPDASSGPAKKRMASSSGCRPKDRLRCCRRCLQLTRGERRAWRSLRAAGVPLLTRCEVLAMHSGDGAIIGMGGFGMCVKGRDPRTGHEVVLKSFHREGLGALEHEAASLWALRRVPGLQRLVGACVQTNQLVSLFAGESLYKYFGAKPRRPAAAALGVFQQAARTLQAMGEAGYAHNDVNPGNACARDQEGRGGPEVTVIDVGMASPVGSGGHFRQVSDPYWLPWVAPELLLHTGPCGESSDAYGLAFLMDEVLERVTHSPSLGPVLAWVDRASSRDPHARPGLAELQEVLQKALAEEGMH